MYPTRDPIRQLHSHRRRDPRILGLALLATLLVGCAAAAAILEDEAVGPTSVEPVVAHLTARDAVANAVFVATPEPLEVSVADPVGPPMPERPEIWSPGASVSLADRLQKNESISTALTRRGLLTASIHPAVSALAHKVDFRRSRPGDLWEVDVDARGAITRLRYAAGPIDVWEARQDGDGYAAHKLEVQTEQRVEVVRGTIDGSLWQTFESTGAGGALAVAFADIFAYTIDFATETQVGDRFAVAVESTWVAGERIGTPKILAARYQGAAGDHQAYRWKDAYYDEAGESIERMFLRSPLATTRITSRYGRRFHPVLGKMKMHAGVDYGAPTGTPVQAVADGRVVFAGWKGANGKLIAIEHAAGYTTYYAHLSQIDGKIRVGTRVKKKQLIGKVGSTGRSTGPHLHFGMKRHGAFINPLEVDFDRGQPLSGADKRNYLQGIAEQRAILSP